MLHAELAHVLHVTFIVGFVSKDAVPRLKEFVAEICDGPDGRKATIPTLLRRLVERDERVRVLYSTGHWLDVDSLDDIVAAGSFE